MKKRMILILTVFFTAVLLAACSGQGGNDEGDTSKFTANIDRYWQENEIDRQLADYHTAEADLAPIRAEMLAMYGENREITGEYDAKFAAKTASGIYVGKADADNVVSWKGIPYAKAPVGELRWKAPQAPDASDRVFEAYYFGHSSIQAEGADELGGLYPQGEDCLNLNVWNNVSDPTENKPIMVWIHGGAYIQGGACDPIYDGANFVKNNPDVIFVSIDYRTDFLGFINLSRVPGAEAYTDTANLGLLDQIRALSWLKENAEAFGGDPERITIFGESAGGGSVSALMLAPQAKGLFRRAIMQSGVTSAYLRSAEKSMEHTALIMDICGAETLGDLMALTESDIRKIETIICYTCTNDYTYPQCDGIVLPPDIRDALGTDARDGIDLMIGTTKDEYNFWTMLLGKEGNLEYMRGSEIAFLAKMDEEQKAIYESFKSSLDGDEYEKLLQYINYLAFHAPARYEAKTHAARGQNAFVYYFTEETNDPELLSCHGYDLGFVLGNVDETVAKDIPAAYRLSAIMQRMWVNFAKTGDPSIGEGEVDGVGTIEWDRYEPGNEKVMVFDAENTRQESDPVKEGCELLGDLFWLRLKKQ